METGLTAVQQGATDSAEAAQWRNINKVVNALEHDMVSVKKEDANNYCGILSALGMEEQGDPVAAVQRLIAATRPTQQGPDAQADMFWDAVEYECFGHDVEEVIEKSPQGGVIKIDCAKRLPSIWVRVLGETESFAYEVITEQEAKQARTVEAVERNSPESLARTVAAIAAAIAKVTK